MAGISKKDPKAATRKAPSSPPSRDAIALWTPPSVHIKSEFPDTIDGWLPFQVPGFNLFTTIPRGLAQWDTGTGKTVLAAGITKAMQTWGDLVIWVVKAGSIENSRRALDELVGIEARKIGGSKAGRDRQYGEVAVAMDTGCPVVVTNYEKLKFDQDYFMALVTNRKVYVVMDEPGEKLRHRDSGTYRAVCKVLYRTTNKVPYPQRGAERPSELRMLFLDATPLRNSPEGFFNLIRLLDPDIYGSTTDFSRKYVTGRNAWGKIVSYKNLKRMGEQVAPITMQIDKDDPEIAKQFPKVQHERVYCDMRDNQQKLYNRLARELRNLKVGKDPSILTHVELLSVINVFQMLANNPIMVLDSAQVYDSFYREAIGHIEEGRMTDSQLGEWIKTHKRGSETAWKFWKSVGNDKMFADTDAKDNCTISKMLELHRKIEQHKGKLVVFSWYADLGIPRMSYWLERWGISHVIYRGGMTLAERQRAEDSFKSDPDLKVFLASDAAGTSLNLEVADHVIHYDLPDEWAMFKQRQDRVSRVTSRFEHVKYTTLIAPGTVEDRKLKLLDRKYDYHKQVLKGKISENAEWLRSQSDLLYVLGQLDDVE